MSDQQHSVSFNKDLTAILQKQQLGEATSQIQYVSSGYCLVIGDAEQALASAAALTDTGFAVVQVDPGVDTVNKRITDNGIAVFTVPELSLTGYLGAYRATVPASESATDKTPVDLGVSVYRESGFFDLVLDLSNNPVLPVRVAPFGYIHATDEQAVADAVSVFLEMRGEFEKPRYFDYNESICAHSRSELTGCSRCIDVCSTGAIRSNGEGVTVDPFLCQGCGSCATVCPSGAMSYAYPRPSNAIERTRQSMLEATADTIVLHTESHQEAIDAASFDHSVLPLLVEEVSAFGADYWLAMLAGPACQIFVVIDSPDDDPNRLALMSQQAWIRPLLAELGIQHLPVQLVSVDQLPDVMPASSRTGDDHVATRAEVESLGKLRSFKPQDFATHNDKRQTIRLALDAFSEQWPPTSATVDLPVGAPFGRINVDEKACTLCMACVSTCPAKALLEGQDTPALRFVESNCLQCGLCETACPESAISLQPRFMWSSIDARKIETLHDEQPFHCVRCHVAFTTQAMIDTMTEKLAGHWMFQDEKAVRRLKLCGDCRVRDMFEDDAAGIAVHQDKA